MSLFASFDDFDVFDILKHDEWGDRFLGFGVFDVFWHFLMLGPPNRVWGSIIQRPWTGTWGSGDRQNPLGVRSKSAKNHVFDDF